MGLEISQQINMELKLSYLKFIQSAIIGYVADEITKTEQKACFIVLHVSTYFPAIGFPEGGYFLHTYFSENPLFPT